MGLNMPHEVNLIATIAAAFGLAMVFGLIATHLRMPPLVGYLFAGILIGPFTPGFVADVGLAAQLAEIGVMLLMFGVGLHFSLADLMAVKRIAVPGAIAQIAVAVLLGAGVASLWGWSLTEAVVFGLCLSVASTVVLLRALEARGQVSSSQGQIAVGWLIVEDLVMVLALVMLPAVAELVADTRAVGEGNDGAIGSPAGLAETIGWTIAKVTAFIAVMLIFGRRLLPKALWWVARTGSQELFRLSVIAVALGVAFGAAKLFDVSFALGAFFAGMMLRESEFSHRAAEESLPLRDAFAVLFFVSVGMLFDPMVILQSPVKLLLAVLIILIGKTIAAVAIVLLFRYSLGTALTVGASLAQIGEFSFILAGLGVSLSMLPAEGQSLVLAAALISIALNSALFAAIEPLRAWLLARSAFARRLEMREDPLAFVPAETPQELLRGQVVLIGHGSVGERVANLLRHRQTPVIVVENNREVVEQLRERGLQAVYGDAASPEVLVQAHVSHAALLVITLREPGHIPAITELARTLNPDIEIVIRADNDDDANLFRAEGLQTVFNAAEELATRISDHVEQVLRKPSAENGGPRAD
jgi:CPA2 family monovalent cation:H+ antiporter-2